jgi:hypothetical protein
VHLAGSRHGRGDQAMWCAGEETTKVSIGESPSADRVVIREIWCWVSEVRAKLAERRHRLGEGSDWAAVA